MLGVALPGQPGVEAPPRRQQQGQRAGTAPGAVQTRHPAPHMGRLHLTEAQPGLLGVPGQPAQGVGVQAHGAVGQATLNPHMLQ
ncbi:hypothetical protein RZS08_64365, partial [Arthrospira platensis SPKY1]|nr:hypothetical protein [Arthrospira platensis SPKY1]